MFVHDSFNMFSTKKPKIARRKCTMRLSIWLLAMQDKKKEVKKKETNRMRRFIAFDTN
jgi:hypothetical protein